MRARLAHQPRADPCRELAIVSLEHGFSYALDGIAGLLRDHVGGRDIDRHRERAHGGERRGGASGEGRLVRRRAFLATIALLGPCAQAVEYPQVRRGEALRFPRDHGSHPVFRTEWWYVTGWLHDHAAIDYGFQVTFFRRRP